MKIYNNDLYKKIDEDEYKYVISFKNKDSLKYIKSIDINIDINNDSLIDKFYEYDTNCIDDFNVVNGEHCYLYVSFEDDLINNIIRKDIINEYNKDKFDDIRKKINNFLGLRCK